MNSFIIQIIITIVTSSLTAAIMSSVILHINKFNKLRTLRRLYYNTYIEPIEQQISLLLKIQDNEEQFSKDYSKLTNSLGTDAKRIKYTLNNEYKYLDSNYAFEVIRLAEFTLSTEAVCQDYLNYYEFVIPTPAGAIAAKNVQLNNLHHCEKQLNDFFTKSKNYMNLKTEIVKTNLD